MDSRAILSAVGKLIIRNLAGEVIVSKKSKPKETTTFPSSGDQFLLRYQDFWAMAENLKLSEQIIKIFESSDLSMMLGWTEDPRFLFTKKGIQIRTPNDPPYEPNTRRKELYNYIETNLIERLYVTCYAFIAEADGTYSGLKDNQPNALSDLIRLYRAVAVSAASNRNKLLRLKKAGRPKQTGWFNNASDFQTALEDVLLNSKTQPTQLQLLIELDQHRLCQKPGKNRHQSHTVLLRNWLHKVNIRKNEETFESALKKTWSRLRTEK
jgi:hypothetical protein